MAYSFLIAAASFSIASTASAVVITFADVARGIALSFVPPTKSTRQTSATSTAAAKILLAIREAFALPLLISAPE